MFFRRKRREQPTGTPETAQPGEQFLPQRTRRRRAESLLVRLIATGGIVGAGTGIGAGMISAGLAGWITGLVVSGVSVILAAILWSSRTL